MYDVVGVPSEPPPDKGPRAWPLVVVLAVLVVGGLGAAAFLVRGGGRDADAVLRATQAAVDDASAFQFTVSGVSRSSEGDEEAGVDTTARTSGEGAWTESRWHVLIDDGYGGYETVLDGDTIYERYDDDGNGSVSNDQWESYDGLAATRTNLVDEIGSMSDALADNEDEPPVDDGVRDEVAVSLAESVYLGPEEGSLAVVAGTGLGGSLTADPVGFLDAIQRMAEPLLVNDAAGTRTLAATLHVPDELAEAFGSPLPDGEIQLDVGPDDRPTALRLDVAQGSSSDHVEIRFTAWDEPVEIALPAPGEIDATPWLDEEALRRVADVALVWPTAPPEDWTLAVYADEAGFMDEDSGCETVELDWDAPLTDDMSDAELDAAGYLYLVLSSADCTLDEDPTPFEPGGPAGLPSRNEDRGSDYTYVEVQVGDTAVSVESSLVGDQLDQVLSSLAPVDVETLIAAASAEPAFPDGYISSSAAATETSPTG